MPTGRRVGQLSSELRKRLFGIDTAEVEFARRGFNLRDEQSVERLERVGRCFVEGYRAALESPEPRSLDAALRERLEPAFLGFGFEGAGMALALLDYLTPWRRDRLRRFLDGPGESHTYMVQIGAGWALARMRARVEGLLSKLDPVLGWLVLDGYGFHEGYFHPEASVTRRRIPSRLRGYARDVFDTGLGRSLWFVNGADPDELAACIARFDVPRQGNLWAGAGLACSYAGGVGELGLARIAELSGPYRCWLAQGAAFAAKARERAEIPTEHTNRAVEVICGTSAELAAKVCDTAFAALSKTARSRRASRSERPGFELWREGIRDALGAGLAALGGAGSSAQLRLGGTRRG